ncbi:hypothetical protein MUN82_08750 [Hymenobacter aerilatus]|uniref:Uncharacterized protein n=1 Tax=Hymenobacter aerilatus TaxID=2932251 RepID=A0A8T9T0K7_9BACT|nr:hypothetical protein [Hymenobacter aerilatus]UOR07171.1 hypothetical protein MUN82_08750 [Hymenobacter aerilatus]
MTKQEIETQIGMMQGDLNVLEGNGPDIFWCVSIGWDDGSRNKLNEDDLGREALNAIFAITVDALKANIQRLKEVLNSECPDQPTLEEGTKG